MQSVVPIRKEPREQAEMVSQLLFGETYQVEEVQDKWLRIIHGYDQHPGWIDRKYFDEITPGSYAVYTGAKSFVQATIAAETELPDGSRMLISAGSNLHGYDDRQKTIRMSDKTLSVRSLRGKIIRTATQQPDITAREFLNLPYLWGGRSSFGMDCSGFVQIVFKIHGITLPRDASQQAMCGKMISSVEETETGDLAFFTTDQDNINHVGMIIGPGEIIHCSGWVRIDRLDNTGIFHLGTGNLTHRLRSLRRITSSFK